MENKLEDVIYANFAQMAYIYWQNVPKGTDLYDALYTRRKKDGTVIYANRSKESRHIFTCYSEDENNLTPTWYKLFEGWELVYSADRPILVKDLFGLEDPIITNNGFYAACFRRGNQYMITFRGTDDLEDAFTDLQLGFFDVWNDQLSCVEWFVRYIQEKYIPDNVVPEFHFTGHSLGGALAQFASTLPLGTPSFCVTWNALGIGTHLSHEARHKWRVEGIRSLMEKFPELDATKVEDSLFSMWIENYKPDGNLLAPSIFTTHESRKKDHTLFRDVLQCLYHGEGESLKANTVKTSLFNFSFKKLGISLGFKDSIKTLEEPWEQQHGSLVMTAERMKTMSPKYQFAARELMQLFILPRLFGENVKENGINQTNCINYYFPDDWTANLQTRLGYVVDVTKVRKSCDGWKHDVVIDFDYEDDSAIRIFRQTLKNFGTMFDKHGVSNFIIYMNDDGNVHPGKIRSTYVRNVIREYFIDAIRASNLMDTVLRSIPGEANYGMKESDLHSLEDLFDQLKFNMNESANRVKKNHPLFWKNLWEVFPQYHYELFQEQDGRRYIQLGRYSNMVLDRVDGRDIRVKIYVM